MLVQKNLAQNEFITIDLSPEGGSLISIGTGAATAAGAVFVIQVETVSGEYVTIKLFNGVTRADASNITGASQYGWAEVYGARKVRITRTDGTGGNGTVAAGISYNG